jgi:hypothetical protein
MATRCPDYRMTRCPTLQHSLSHDSKSHRCLNCPDPRISLVNSTVWFGGFGELCPAAFDKGVLSVNITSQRAHSHSPSQESEPFPQLSCHPSRDLLGRRRPIPSMNTARITRNSRGLCHQETSSLLQSAIFAFRSNMRLFVVEVPYELPGKKCFVLTFERTP